ncbi:hypothetical protein H7200_01880 [Candidatus Saccharibacteria bacterium]|nr:hypothetical protein [Candidatus Saccharibacteria bacterium]
MERTEILYATNLPGYDALTANVMTTVEPSTLIPYLCEQSYRQYLANETYDKYLHIHKVQVGDVGADQLISIGDTLSQESLPRYLDAAAWAYTEAALAQKGSAVANVALVSKAETLWQQALSTHKGLERGVNASWFDEDHTMNYRIALNLAYTPLIKSLLVGDTAASVRQRAFADTLAIAQLAGVHINLSKKENDYKAVSEYSGFLHECNALLALLYLNDPRYIPIPSSARADTGYYHRDQTHDIMVLNQHWGHIKKIIPIEVKASASLKDRNRYKALIIRGKMHLSVNGTNDARDTLGAFADVFDHSTNKTSQQKVDHAAVTVKELLRLYQLGMSAETVAVNSLTQFHDSEEVAAIYPELSKVSKRFRR